MIIIVPTKPGTNSEEVTKIAKLQPIKNAGQKASGYTRFESAFSPSWSKSQATDPQPDAAATPGILDM